MGIIVAMLLVTANSGSIAVREQRLLTEVLGELRKLLPFPLLGLAADHLDADINRHFDPRASQPRRRSARCQ